MGEGSAVLVLEEFEAAQARGAHIYCEVTGYANRGNAYHMTRLRPDGAEMAEAILDAMSQAGSSLGHRLHQRARLGNWQNDRHETAAYKRSLGDQAYKIPISSIKSMIGHSLGGIGAVEMAACALAIDRGVVPPTALGEPDPECDLDYTPREAPAEADRRRALDRKRLRRLPVRDDPGPSEESVAGGGDLMAQAPSPSAPPCRMPTAGPSSPASASSRQADRQRRLVERAKAGESAIRRITRFDPSQYPAQLAGEVDGFDATDYLEQRLIVQTDHWTHMALAATQFALDDASTTRSGTVPDERDHVQRIRRERVRPEGDREPVGKGPIFVGAYQSIAWFYAATTGQIAIKYGMKGPCGVICQEGAGGLEALWHSRRNILRGVDFVVSGGTEAPIGPYALTCQLTNGRLSLETDPADAYRPFDERANGYVMGEVAQS